MDALKFIEERNRMCDYYTKNDVIGGCANCPEFDSACNVVRYVTPEYIADVEKWSREHPRKTQQSKFLDMFPMALIKESCPPIGYNRNDGCFGVGKDCKKCWLSWLKDDDDNAD